MCLSGIVGGASALIGASSADSAADAQTAAANNQLALQREVYEDTTQNLSPYLESGNNALAAYNYELGLGPLPTFGGTPLEVVEFTETTTTPNASHNSLNPYWNSRDGNATRQDITNTQTRYRVGDEIFSDRAAADEYAAANATDGTEYGGYTETPGYDFRLNEGLDAVSASVAGQRGLNSGSAIKGLTEYSQDYATNEYNNYLNRLSGQASAGQSAAALQANAAQNYATGASNSYANIGNAGAAGAIGINNAAQGGLNTFANIWGYHHGSNPGANTWWN